MTTQHCCASYITAPGLRAVARLGRRPLRRGGEASRSAAAVLGYTGGSRVQLEIFTTIEHDAARRQYAGNCDLPSATESQMSLITAQLVAGVFAEPQNKRIAKALTAIR